MSWRRVPRAISTLCSRGPSLDGPHHGLGYVAGGRAHRRRPHLTHPDLGSVLRWIMACGPRYPILVHIDQLMD